MIAVLAIFFAAAFPSNSKVSWMRPESFHLTVGMKRTAAVKALESNGWHTKKGDAAGQLVVDYSDDKSLTLQFAGERLTSIRFELFTILHDAPKAFEEERAFLRASLGKPRQGTKKILIYDHKLPNVMAILSADPKSEQAQKGVGMVVVRYYDPAVK
ncbi:MAG TPA: hypothetical protein VGQ65_25320 [Thermoanaerobaculia bacterium]|jgi:hypothetical protein|nr:hypothetical protein [Thermoanaerobaculia bacterium]